MLNEEARTLFKHWFERGTFEEGAWNTGNRFEHFYFAFIAIAENLSGASHDSVMLRWVNNNENLLSIAFDRRLESLSFLDRLERLRQLCAVKDARNPEIEKTITDIRNMSEVIAVIYMIRCNYAHGHKPANGRNEYLFEAGSHLLKEWLEPIYTREDSLLKELS